MLETIDKREFLKQLGDLERGYASDKANPGSYRCEGCDQCAGCMFCTSCSACYKCTYCLGHKMGPLMTADFVGLDTMLFICEVLEEEFGSAYKPSPLLKRLVESGQLGAKTGIGFYTWDGYKASGINPDVARYRIK